MIKLALKSFLFALTLMAISYSPTQADIITQTVTVDQQLNLLGPGNLILVDDQFFSLTADPFDSSLGTLNSFTVSFSGLSATATGVVGSGDTHGSISVNGPSGNFSVDGVEIGTSGTGGGQSGATGETISAMATLPDFTQTFTVTDPSLDQALLAAVTGTNSFDVRYAANVPLFLDNVGDIAGSAVGTITLQYDFTPSQVPEPSSTVIAILGSLAMFARRRRF